MKQTETNVPIIETVSYLLSIMDKSTDRLIKFKKDQYRSQYQKVVADYIKEKKL